MRILIFKSGLLGDTLTAVPAIHCLRVAYPGAKIIYLWQKVPVEGYVTAKDVLDGSGLVDEFIHYTLDASTALRSVRYLKLWLTLLAKSIDLAVVLEGPFWSGRRKRFLRLCGIKTVIGPDQQQDQIYRSHDGRLEESPHISDALIGVLEPLGITLPQPSCGQPTLPPTTLEISAVDQWTERHIPKQDMTRKWIAIAPWSNMPAKRWPLANFINVITGLIADSNVFPILFGGPEERAVSEEIVSACGRGAVTAGTLTVREGIELMRRCALYVGNDTGAMHMAVSAGIKCVAIFSSRDMPGRWEPYGKGHVVFRTFVDCEGCMLRECIHEKMKCITSISARDVAQACVNLLADAPRATRQC